MTVGRRTAILACSPRLGGNTDAAAAILARELGGAATTRVCDHAILPCISCGGCAAGPAMPCPLQHRDTSAPLFSLLEGAEALVLVSPIYFYHLPAQLKALMDRSQPWWAGARAAPRKTVFPVLIAARERGDNLFTGSLLSLQYWLSLFGYTLADPLTLRCLDEAGALAASTQAREALVAYAGLIRQGSSPGSACSPA